MDISISEENAKIRKKITEFDIRIEKMHQDFYKYYQRQEHRLPDWEGLERELVIYSRKRINDLALSKNLDRVLYKFQNRKKIWLNWVDELHRDTIK